MKQKIMLLRRALPVRVMAIIKPPQKKKTNPRLLLAIEACQTEKELDDLLYATFLRTEAEVDAFDHRYQQLSTGK
jgi:hypothetical protein